MIALSKSQVLRSLWNDGFYSVAPHGLMGHAMIELTMTREFTA